MKGIYLRAEHFRALMDKIANNAEHKGKTINSIHWSGEDEATILFSAENGPGEKAKFRVLRAPAWEEIDD